MTKNVIAVVVGSVCAMFLWEARSVGQEAVSGTSLVISGTASISGSTVLGALAVSGTAEFNALDVVGAPDFQNNTLFFGTSGTSSALSVIYDDGGDSSITLQSTRPTSVWNWSRLTVSGSSTRNAMQLDASNRLILTGTAVSNPPQLVLDPNGAVSLNGSNLLTQAAADVLYFSATAGLVASNGNVGIGTTTPMAKLDVAGNMKVGMDVATSGAQLQINPSTAGMVGQTIRGHVSQTASLQEWQNSSGNILASIKIANGGTPAYDYGLLSLFSAESGAPASLYVSEDVMNTSARALYITPPSSGRVFMGDPSHLGYSLDLQYMYNLQAPPTVRLSARAFSSSNNLGTALHPEWIASILTGDQFSAGIILYPGSWTSNILGDMGGEGMSSLPFLVDTRDGHGYQRGAGYIFGNMENYNTYSYPHTLWWADQYQGNHLMALQMTGELDVNIQKASAKGLAIRGASSQEGDLTQWQNASGTALSVINHNGWMGIASAIPQAALDVNGSAKIAGNLSLSGTGSLTLPDGTVLSASNTLRNVVSSGTISNVTLGGTTNIQGGLNIAGTASVNGSSLLTTTTADARYIISGGTSGGTAMGSGTASAAYSTAMGRETLASGWGATAMGSANVASGDRAVVMGIQNLAEGADSVAMGIYTVSHGFSSLVSGVWSRAWGNCSFSIGDGTWSGGNSSVATGISSRTDGLAAVAMGDHTLGSGHSSISLGAYTTAIGDHSQSLGYSATAQSFAQTVIGQFNVLPYTQGSQGIWMTQWQPTDELFTIGNGTDQQHPSNAVVVKKNGDTTVYGKFTVSGSNAGIVVSGVEVTSGTTTKIVASGSNLVLIPEQGDLSMGDFTDGAKPQ